MDLPFADVTDGLLILVGLVLLIRGKRMVNYVIDATARALVKSINGQLGLDGIREDVQLLKVQVGDTQRQLEIILTDLD